MNRILTIALSATMLCAPGAVQAADWKPVPDNKGLFVDMAHIRHIAATTGPDTKVDIMRHGQMSEVYVRCGDGDRETKDIPIVEIQPDVPGGATPVGAISMKALRETVCAPQRR